MTITSRLRHANSAPRDPGAGLTPRAQSDLYRLVGASGPDAIEVAQQAVAPPAWEAPSPVPLPGLFESPLMIAALTAEDAVPAPVSEPRPGRGQSPSPEGALTSGEVVPSPRPLLRRFQRPLMV
ncbi:MAG: hypothetical protein FWD59_09945, partial [Micrococcales bacterium]|nr:hypothetical protein [Micrococcales bacterium]